MSASSSSATRCLDEAVRTAKEAVAEALEVHKDDDGESVARFRSTSHFNTLVSDVRTSPLMALEPHLVAARGEIKGPSGCSLKEEKTRLNLVAVLAKEIWPDELPLDKTACQAILCVDHPGVPRQKLESAVRSFGRWKKALAPLRAQLEPPGTHGPSTLDGRDDALENMLPDPAEVLAYEGARAPAPDDDSDDSDDDGCECWAASVWNPELPTDDAPSTPSAGDEVASVFVATCSLESPDDDSGDDGLVCSECSHEPPTDDMPPTSPATPATPTSPATPATPNTPTGGDGDGSGRSREPSTEGAEAPATAVAPPAFARCARDGCPCEASFNGLAGEYCCLMCRGSDSAEGVPCTRNRHRTPRETPVVTPVAKPACMDGVWACTRKDCPCTASYNGKHGEYCCQTCKDGQKCESNYHPKPQQRAPKGRRRS